jgi:hypothetical protein
VPNLRLAATRRLRSARFAIYVSLQVVLILAGALVTTSGAVGVAIGTSMIATGASGLIVFGWVVFDEAEVERRRVSEAFGFVTAFPHRSIQIREEYHRRVRQAAEQIDVMGYGLNALREDFKDQFREWAGRVRVRILLVDLDAPPGTPKYVDLRDLEEGNSPGRTKAEIERFVGDTEPLWSHGGTFQLRLARTLPSINMFRIDDEIFWGPYLISSSKYGRASRNLPTMIVRRPGYMYDRLLDHFDEIWASDVLSRPPGRSRGARP